MTSSLSGTLTLVGGGWTPEASSAVYGPFIQRVSGGPVVVVLLDEGDGEERVARSLAVLERLGHDALRPVLVPLGGTFDAAELQGAAGLFVCGGLTPGYAEALRPAAGAVRHLVEGGGHYLGFSAGAAVAAGRALVGGWRSGGVPVCPEDAGEDLDEVTVVDGLGLVGPALDVHAGAWGTLGRLVAAVGSGAVASGVAVDEDTAVVVEDGGWRVVGAGTASVVAPDGGGGVRVVQRRRDAEAWRP